MKNETLKARLEYLINNNPFGFTANANGELMQLNKGYAVSITNNSHKNINKLIDNILLKNTPITENSFYGGWSDTKTNNNFLDITLIKDNLKDALQTAKDFNQLAVFDFSKMQEVRV